jgi:hypothetical protein
MFVRVFCALLFMFSASLASANTLTVILPVSDDAHAVNARIVGRYFQKHHPQKPEIVYRAMPGAASVVAANYLYNIAPRDGSTIGVFYKNIPLVGAIGGPNIQFDPAKFTWLGSTANGRKDAVLLISRKQYDGTELIIGTDNVVLADPVRFIRESTGWNIRQVTGYKSNSEIRLAVERGEVDAIVNSMIGIKTTRPQWLRSDSPFKIILQFGNGRDRHPEFSQVPTLAEIIASDKQELLKIFETQFALLRPYVAPPNLSAEQAILLRNMFISAVTDSDYVAEAKKANIDVNLIDWREAEAIVRITASAPRNLLNSLR